MRTQAEYRKLAEDCVRLAQTAREIHRAMLLNMADTWLQFADRVANEHQLIKGYGADSEDLIETRSGFLDSSGLLR